MTPRARRLVSRPDTRAVLSRLEESARVEHSLRLAAEAQRDRIARCADDVFGYVLSCEAFDPEQSDKIAALREALKEWRHGCK